MNLSLLVATFVVCWLPQGSKIALIRSYLRVPETGCRASENFENSGEIFPHICQYYFWCRASAYFKKFRELYLCKQFGPRSGPTFWQNVGPDLDQNCLTPWKCSWENFLKELILKIRQQTTPKFKKLPSMQKKQKQPDYCLVGFVTLGQLQRLHGTFIMKTHIYLSYR